MESPGYHFPTFGHPLATPWALLSTLSARSSKNHQQNTFGDLSFDSFESFFKLKYRLHFRCLFEGAFGRLGSTFGFEKEAKLLQNGRQNGARWRVNAKLQNIDLGLYIPRFGEVGHPPKHMFLTAFLGIGRDAVPRGFQEATFLDFCDFGIHFGDTFSSLCSIIFQASKRGPGVFQKWNPVEHTFGLGGNRGEHPTYGNHPSLCKAMRTVLPLTVQLRKC